MNLIIYHVEGSRSSRVVWLCEELGLPYAIKFKRGDGMGSLEAIRAVCPLMPVAARICSIPRRNTGLQPCERKQFERAGGLREHRPVFAYRPRGAC